MTDQPLTYKPRTVISAQRRVLRLLAGFVRANFKPDRLYSDGRGLMTGAELLQHCQQASELKVKR